MSWLQVAAIGADILGGLLGKSASDKASKRAHQFNMAQLQFQQDMAHNQLQWRTEDAQKAGLHPLFALGASPYMASPISYDGGTGGGEYLAQMGQDVSRAISAVRSERQRQKDAAMLAAEQAIQRKREEEMYNVEMASRKLGLEEQYLSILHRKAQMAGLNQPGMAPGYPEVGDVVPNTPSVIETRPALNTSPAAGNDGREAGEIRGYGFSVTDDGGLSVERSRDMQERLEEDTFGSLGWTVRNRIIPFFSGLRPPDVKDHPIPSWAPRNAIWRWHANTQQFLPWVRTSRGGVFITRPRARR